jgi:hypothetical protein
MTDKMRTRDTLAMDGKLTSRSDSYEIKSSQVKQRPPGTGTYCEGSGADTITS